MKKAFYTAVAALSLVAAPTMAAAAPVATPLTQPAAETVGGDSALRDGGGRFFIVGIAVVFIGLGIYFAVHNRHNHPNSP